MAWAALIPVAMELMKSGQQQQQAPATQLPPPPSLGDRFAANAAKYEPGQHSYLTPSNPFSQFPIGGGSRGSNG